MKEVENQPNDSTADISAKFVLGHILIYLSYQMAIHYKKARKRKTMKGTLELEPRVDSFSEQAPRRLMPNEKICMSIMEAAEYSSIGHNKLREIIADNPDLDFVLHKGTKQVLIKRPQFDEWISGLNNI